MPCEEKWIKQFENAEVIEIGLTGKEL